MQRYINIFLLSLMLLACLSIVAFIGNNDILELHTKLLQSYAKQYPKHIEKDWHEAAAEARGRVHIYRNTIMQEFLLDGMLVNKEHDGQDADVCDSLLFSSLLYVAFHKLNMTADADTIFSAIKRAEVSGKWWRHPRCSLRLSRDMTLGLLTAMSQRPLEGKAIMRRFVNFVADNQGFVGDGPFHVSYLSPGLAQLTRHIALVNGVSERQIPHFFDVGFSTLEIDILWPQRGYQSHLAALVIWLEMELQRQHQVSLQQPLFVLRSLPKELNPLFSAVDSNQLEATRQQWLTYRLAKMDRKNLFFRYLHFRSAGALSLATRLLLLQQLLAMPQFPALHTPTSCDRKADYVWQRDSKELAANDTEVCSHRYSGVDFIWLAALLLEDSITSAE